MGAGLKSKPGTSPGSPVEVRACRSPVAASPAKVPAVAAVPVPQACGSVTQRAGAAGKPPSVHTVLAGAEVFHLPQFLLIKRMNYISVASSGNLSPLVLSTPELCFSLRKEQGGLCGTSQTRSLGCRGREDGAEVLWGLGCAPHLRGMGSSLASRQARCCACSYPPSEINPTGQSPS